MFKYLRKMLSFYIDLFFAKFFATHKKPDRKSLCVVYYGLIGDYILFRNFFTEIRTSSRYKDYKITFVGNKLWANLSEFLEKDLVDDFVWIDHRKWDRRIWYRLMTLIRLSRLSFEELMLPFDSRTLNHDDLIAYAIQSEHKYTVISCNRNYGNSKYELEQRKISNTWYEKQFPIDYSNVWHEFNINQRIYTILTGEKYHSTCPHIYLSANINFSWNKPQKYIVLAIGGSRDFKCWPIENYFEVAKMLLKETDYSIVFCGDKKDSLRFAKISRWFQENEKERVIDLCGKTSLIDLLAVLKEASFLICGDTCFIHMYIALRGNNSNAAIIYPLKTFNRFVPYPENIIKNYYYIRHSKTENNTDAGKINLFSGVDSYPINEIGPEKMLDLIRNNILPKLK